MKTVIAALLLVGSAHADYTKECLENNGYTSRNFLTYDFSLASACVDAILVAKTRQSIKQEREFVLANPWYRGQEWNWKEDMKNCQTLITTKHTRNPRVCVKDSL